MTIEQKRIKILTECIRMLSDWMCELPEWYDGMEVIGGRVEMSLDVLQSLRGYILAGSPVIEEDSRTKLGRLLENSDIFDDALKAEILKASDLVSQYASKQGAETALVLDEYKKEKSNE